jgi:hypothetical protein
MSINRTKISQEVNKPNNKNNFKNANKMYTPKDKYIPKNNYKMLKPQNIKTQNLLQLLQNN